MAIIIMNQTPLSMLIADYEHNKHLKFVPNDSFYLLIGINRIRFWQLVKGKKELLAHEIRALSDYFGISVNDLI